MFSFVKHIFFFIFEDAILKYLFILKTFSKIIKNIVVKFNTNLTIADLSEGEKKLLLIKAALEFAGQEDSILILNEPNTGVDVASQNRFYALISALNKDENITIKYISDLI